MGQNERHHKIRTSLNHAYEKNGQRKKYMQISKGKSLLSEASRLIGLINYSKKNKSQ